MHKTGRRDFLKFSGAAGLFTAAGCAGFPAITSVRSPNGRLCHACIGTGNMAGADLYEFALHPRLEVTALCDVDANYLAAAKAKHPNARVYRDWRELIDKEGDSIDSLNVSIPDHNHTAVAAAALRAGKHVYLQKPLCKTMDEARLLRRLAKDSGKVTQMGAQYIATGADRQMVKLLRSMELGPVEHAYFFSTRKGMSRRRRHLPASIPPPKTLDWNLWLGTAAERPYAPEVYHPLIWRVWRDLGSGWVGDIGCHLMSSLWMGCGLGNLSPLDVYAETETDADANVKDLVWPTATHIVWNMPPVKVTDMKSVRFEWFDGCSEPDALAPAKYRPPAEIDALFAKTPYGKRLHEGKAVKCRDGWILQIHGQEKMYIVKNDGKVSEGPAVGSAPSHYHEFVNRCLEGGTASSDFAWSTHMMELILTGEVAERMPGRILKWDASTHRFDNPEATAFLSRTYRSGWEIPGLA